MRVTIDVNEYQTSKGTMVTRFNGPIRWSEVFDLNRRVYVRHGILPSICRLQGIKAACEGLLPDQTRIYEPDERSRAVNHARSYARKKV